MVERRGESWCVPIATRRKQQEISRRSKKCEYERKVATDTKVLVCGDGLNGEQAKSECRINDHTVLSGHGPGGVGQSNAADRINVEVYGDLCFAPQDAN